MATTMQHTLKHAPRRTLQHTLQQQQAICLHTPTAMRRVRACQGCFLLPPYRGVYNVTYCNTQRNTHCNTHCTTHCNIHCNTHRHASSSRVSRLSLVTTLRSRCRREVAFVSRGAITCVAVRCSVLQCVAVCCSVFQCVAVCCSVQHYRHCFSVKRCHHMCCSACCSVRCSV